MGACAHTGMSFNLIYIFVYTTRFIATYFWEIWLYTRNCYVNFLSTNMIIGFMGMIFL